MHADSINMVTLNETVCAKNKHLQRPFKVKHTSYHTQITVAYLTTLI